MKVNKAFKFLINPNKPQIELIEKTFGCVRFIYNKMLNDKINYFIKNEKTLHLTPAFYKKEFPWLKEVDSLALANAQLQLEDAYDRYFNKQNNFPKFKSKHYKKQSYTTNKINNNIRVDFINNTIVLPKLGVIKAKYHRLIPNDYLIKSVTISKNHTGKYYVSILTEYEYEAPYRTIDSNRSIGLDYSSNSLYVDSNGQEANMPHYYRLLESKLAKENKKLSHMKLHSNNWYKQLNRINKIYEKIANQRKDYLHKLSTSLVNSYDIIALEDINMQGISQTLHLGKPTIDNGFGMLRSMLSYKAKLNGTAIVKIDKLYPSSKLCHICGYKKIDLTLNDRSWTCPICNATHNRDTNAAINILKEGLRLLNINDNCVSDNSIIYNTSNPWAKGDSSFYLNSLEFLSEKQQLIINLIS